MSSKPKKILTFLQLLPVVLSLLLLGAHFLRAEIIPLVVFFALTPFILLHKRSFIPLVIQGLLLLGTVEWIRTAVTTIIIRESQAQSWQRYLIIMSSIVVFTLLSALILFSKNLKLVYGKSKKIAKEIS